MVEFYVNRNEIKISDRSVAILVVDGVVMSIIGRLNFDFSTINIYYAGGFLLVIAWLIYLQLEVRSLKGKISSITNADVGWEVACLQPLPSHPIRDVLVFAKSKRITV